MLDQYVYKNNKKMRMGYTTGSCAAAASKAAAWMLLHGQILPEVELMTPKGIGLHLEVLEQFLVHAANAGFGVKDITFSPIKGPEGNIEYLGYLTTREVPPYTGDLAALVEQSHSAWKEAEG